MVALPGQLFYTTQIPVCLWFMTKNKAAQGQRNREGETLFIDARNMGSMIDRTHKELTDEDLKTITDTYHNWRNTTSENGNSSEVDTYIDIAGFCKSANLQDIAKNDYVLTPGRYVGIAEEEDDGIPFEEKMTDLSQTLFTQMQQSEALDAEIKANLKLLGYE